MAEELAAACASTSLQFLISKLGMLPVINFGSEEMKQKYLPRICTGESQASYGLSEADAGSDVASMVTRAERDGEDWILNGSKAWITNAGISDLYTVFARTSGDRHTGITAFLVEAEWGVEVEKLEHKLGIKGSPTGVIRLEDVRVPDTNRIGEVGEGFPIVLPFLGPSNLRDGISLIPDGYFSPSFYYTSGYEGFGLAVYERFNRTSLHIGEYGSLKADALDPYTLFRDAYHQARLKRIQE